MFRAGFQILFEAGLMEFARGPRHENRERFANEFFRVVSKYLFRRGVRKNDCATFVDTDHRVACCFYHDSVSGFAPPKFVLGPLAIVNVGGRTDKSEDFPLRIA